jgi:hypothetical protein
MERHDMVSLRSLPVSPQVPGISYCDHLLAGTITTHITSSQVPIVAHSLRRMALVGKLPKVLCSKMKCGQSSSRLRL